MAPAEQILFERILHRGDGRQVVLRLERFLLLRVGKPDATLRMRHIQTDPTECLTAFEDGGDQMRVVYAHIELLALAIGQCDGGNLRTAQVIECSDQFGSDGGGRVFVFVANKVTGLYQLDNEDEESKPT